MKTYSLLGFLGVLITSIRIFGLVPTLIDKATNGLALGFFISALIVYLREKKK